MLIVKELGVQCYCHVLRGGYSMVIVFSLSDLCVRITRALRGSNILGCNPIAHPREDPSLTKARENVSNMNLSVETLFDVAR